MCEVKAETFSRVNKAVMECNLGVNRGQNRRTCFRYDGSNKEELVENE